MNQRARIVGLIVIAVRLAAPALADEPSSDGQAFFENQVRPVLAARCFKCHGDKKQESSLRMNSRAALLQGGERGPAIVPSQPQDSLLIQAIGYQGELHMPPDEPLSGEQVAVLTRWIELGAPWPGDAAAAHTRSGPPTEEERRFWSFQPIADPPVPAVHDQAWPLSPIDHFILHRLEAKALTPVAVADPHTLVRRVTFDLTGLPPTPGEIDAFVSDPSPEAFTQVVDRLLASPAYGERWGRHWLDVVRYADTAGETADYPVREAWQYRNYVIQAFNDDKPYDEFIREQVAGDLLAAEGPPEKFAERIIATGYIAISRRFGFDSINYQHLCMQDTIDTLGQSILGLSLGCARCHDHKYDPIPAADYYALYGIFASTRYAFPGDEQTKRPHDFVPLVPPGQLEPLQRQHQEQLAALDAEFERINAEKQPVAEQAAAAPENAELKAKLAELEAQLAKLAERSNQLRANPPYALAYAVTEGTPQNSKVQKRGDPLKVGDEVPRRFLQVLGGDPLPPEETGSGRRQLAAWLTRPENPLTARVLVNRVWQHHFGEGLVGTENDFGVRGQAPTHPELLDFLSSRFMESGWSIKALHRLLLSSRVYQLSSRHDAACAAVDPANELLWRFRRRRLDAEEIRDSLLALGGQLDRSPGGPHPFPNLSSWGFTQHAPFAAVYETNRRSVYLMAQRSQRHPFLALFDGADPNATTPQRTPTTVPTQALFMMNDPLVHAQSENVARQLIAAASEANDRVRLAYRVVLAREADTAELQEAAAFVDLYRQRLQQTGGPGEQHEPLAWAAYVRTLFSSNEFVFVD